MSVILPAFDEAQRIAATVRDAQSVLDDAIGSAYELILVDDGSCDATLEAAFDVADECPRCTVISYSHNAGKGGALRRGLASAKGDHVAFFDSDGDISAATLLELYRAMANHPGVSAVVGRRRWTVPRPWHRRVASNLLSLFGRAILDIPVYETQAGVKVFVRKDLLRVVPECREHGYLFDLELLARMQRRGFSMASVDILQARARPSRIGMRTGLVELAPVFRIWRDLRGENRKTGHSLNPRLPALSIHTPGEEGGPT